MNFPRLGRWWKQRQCPHPVVEHIVFEEEWRIVGWRDGVPVMANGRPAVILALPRCAVCGKQFPLTYDWLSWKRESTFSGVEK